MNTIQKLLLLGASLATTAAGVQAFTSPITHTPVVKSSQLLELTNSTQHQRVLLAQQGINPIRIYADRKHLQANNLTGRRLAATRLADGQEQVFYGCTGEGYEDSKHWLLTITYDEANHKATLANLGGFCDGLTTSEISASYSDGKIILPTKTFDDSESSTIIGKFYGFYTVYLTAGQFMADQGAVKLEDQLVINISEDKEEVNIGGKTLVAATANNGVPESVDYCRFAEFANVQEGCTTRISSSALTFEPVLAGAVSEASLTLYATGSEAADYSVTIADEQFSVSSASGNVKACDVKDLTFTFSAANVGEYNSVATIQFGRDTYEIALSAAVKEAPLDFSAIVTEGDASLLKWNNRKGDFAWELTNDGKAIPGNLGIRPEFNDEEFELDPENYDPRNYSHLEASYNTTVPLAIDFGFLLSDDNNQDFTFSIDDEPVFCYYANFGRSYRYNYVLPAGEHTICWTYATSMWASRKTEVYLHDMHLALASAWQGVVDLSPIKADGWSNYNGSAVAHKPGATMQYELQLNEPSFFSFECELAEEASLDVYVDDTKVESLDATKKHFDVDFITTGQHTVKLVNSADSRAAITEAHCAAGQYNTRSITCTTVAKSYFDANYGFSITNGQIGCYDTKITLCSDGRVLFEDLYPESSDWDGKATLLGRFMADGKIHIAHTSREANEGILYGYVSGDWGTLYDQNFYLFGGSLNEKQEFAAAPEILISVNTDTTRFTVETGFGLTNYYMHTEWGYGIDFMQPGTQIFTPAQGLGFNLEAIDFGQTPAGTQLSRQLMIINQGEKTQYAISVDGKDKACFAATPQYGEVEAMSPVFVNIELNAVYAGQYEAELVISTEDDDYTLPLYVNVLAAEDYASICTEGGELITWSSVTEYPWHVEDGVATTTNQGINNSISSLVADFSVPEGYVATFSYNGDCKMEPDCDGFNLFIDDKAAFVESRRNDSICNQFILDAGKHQITFMYGKNAQDEYPAAGDYVSIRNVRLHLEPKAADLALQYYNAPIFTELTGVGDLAVGDVYLVNKGTNPLKLIGIEGDGYFSGMMIQDLCIAPGDTMAVTLLYEPTEAGHHNGNVILHTSAGDQTFPVQAQADYVRYLGATDRYIYSVPYCNLYFMYDIWPIYTQTIYPAEWMEGLEGYQIQSMTFFSLGASDAPYDCPDSEWQFGETSLTRVSEEVMPGLTTVYRGIQPSLVNGELTIEFDTPYTYQGGNLMYQNLMHEKELQGGTFFGFPYLGTNGDPASSGVWMSVYQLQTFEFIPYMRLKYLPETEVSIQQTTENRQAAVVSVEYVDAQGRRQNSLHKGMNIITVTYADGTHHTCKQLVR